MKIYAWNVNGLRAIEKKGFLDWVQHEHPDILCLQETKIQAEQLTYNLRNIPGYHSYFSCAERKGYSGVATYSRQKPLAVHHGIGIDRFDREGRIIVAEYPVFTHLNIYFPNSQKGEERLIYKLEFHQAVLDYCDRLVAEGKKVVISGDFNTAHREIDLKNPKANVGTSGFLPVERAMMDKFLSRGYVDTFRQLHPDTVKYSWWSYIYNARSRGAGWRIDYHLVSENLFNQVTGADILDHVMGSDHCPVSLELNLTEG